MRLANAIRARRFAGQNIFVYSSTGTYQLRSTLTIAALLFRSGWHTSFGYQLPPFLDGGLASLLRIGGVINLIFSLPVPTRPGPTKQVPDVVKNDGPAR